jgi:hypothetical protein
MECIMDVLLVRWSKIPTLSVTGTINKILELYEKKVDQGVKLHQDIEREFLCHSATWYELYSSTRAV